MPLVTVFCLTYNHVNYIKDALDGFLKQKTDFKVKVFVYDDASTDGTDRILLEYKERYPTFFDVYISPINTYNLPNREEILQNLYKEHFQGKYVAICEGDDYWIDPYKLQLQVEFLEQHSDVTLVASASQWLDCETKKKCEYRPYTENKYLSAEEIIEQRNGNLTTASLVVTKDSIIWGSDYPQCDVIDIPLQLSALSKGKVFYFNRVMSCYRYRHEGSWSKSYSNQVYNQVLHNLIIVKFYLMYDRYTNYKFHESLKMMVIKYLYASIFNNNDEIDANELFLILDEIAYLNTEFKFLIEQQERILEIVKNKKIHSKHIFLYSQAKYHLIYGCGTFAKYLSKYYRSNNIPIDGYIVSNGQSFQEYIDEKPIWEIKNCPLEYSSIFVSVAINQNFEEEIKHVLQEYGIEHIYTPYWFEFDSFN